MTQQVRQEADWYALDLFTIATKSSVSLAGKCGKQHLSDAEWTAEGCLVVRGGPAPLAPPQRHQRMPSAETSTADMQVEPNRDDSGSRTRSESRNRQVEKRLMLFARRPRAGLKHMRGTIHRAIRAGLIRAVPWPPLNRYAMLR
jgi:hypothetical protein